MIPFIWTIRKGKTIVTEWRSMISGAGDGGGDWLQRSMKEWKCLYQDCSCDYIIVYIFFNFKNYLFWTNFRSTEKSHK